MRCPDGAGDGAYLVEGGRHGDDAVTGDGAVGWLDADATGQCCGLADGAAGVSAGARGAWKAVTAAAEPPPEPPGARSSARVADYAECGVLVGGALGESVEVGLAEDGHACFADLRVHGAVVGLIQPSSMRDAAVVGWPWYDDEVLDAMGTPASRAVPCLLRTASTAAAVASASSALMCREGVEAILAVCSVVAQGAPSVAAMRSRCAWVSST